MKLNEIAQRGGRGSKEHSEPPNALTMRSLIPLVEGTAASMLEIDSFAFNGFRETVSRLAIQMRDGLPDDEKLMLTRSVLHEFEQYRKLSDEAIRNRLSGWRTLVSKLLADLLVKTGIDPSSGGAAPLRVASLLTGEEIHGFIVELANFLRVDISDPKQLNASQLARADRSTTNHNSSGLRGGGAAFKHVSKIIDGDLAGYVVLFQLNCLNIICDRFGLDAVEDSLMAIAAFLTHSLRSDDAIYHWSDSTVLAVLETPASLQQVTAAMRRIVDNNRDITIQIGGRTVMLRVPMDFEITSISRLTTAEDLHKLPAPSVSRW